MPFRPSKRREQAKRVTARIDDQELVFSYRPAVVTPELMDEMATLGESERAYQQVAQQVVMFVSSWDIGEPRLNGHYDADGNQLPATDDAGNILYDQWPVDYAHVAKLDFGVLQAIVTAIATDLNPGEATAAASVAG